MWSIREFKRASFGHAFFDFLESVTTKKPSYFELSKPPEQRHLIFNETSSVINKQPAIKVTFVYVEKSRDDWDCEWESKLRFLHTYAVENLQNCAGMSLDRFSVYEPILLPDGWLEYHQNPHIECDDWLVFPGHLDLANKADGGLLPADQRRFIHSTPAMIDFDA